MTCNERRLIDAHFAGRIAPADERRMREHLAGCAGCRAYYERHQVLAGLDPAALSPEERIGRGLGLRPRRRRTVVPMLAAAGAAVAAALLLLVLWPRLVGDEEGYQVRGGRTAEQPAVRLLAYRVSRGQQPRRVEQRIAPDDELAFAYGNRAGKGYLLVFGVEDDGRVRWYHPAWNDPAKNPRAVRIRPGTGLHELPEAVAHELRGKTLLLSGVFVDRPLSVKDIERLLRKHPPGKLPIQGALQTRQQVRIKR